MNLQSFLQRFDSTIEQGSTFKVRCPAHEDHRASLAVKLGNNGGIVLYCHAGCSTRSILEAMALKMSDIMPERSQSGRDTHIARPRLIEGFSAIYDYKNVDGSLVFQVCRRPDKQFRQRRPDGNGGWIWKTGKSVKRVPYRLPELLNRPTVFIVEGEKDADALWSIGIPATCNAGGAGKWGQTEAKCLREAGCVRAIIIPDNDAPGITHANEVAARCRGKGIAVTIIPLPGLPEHGDVSDWLAEGHGRADLERIVAATPYVVPNPANVATTPRETASAPAQDAIGGYPGMDIGTGEGFTPADYEPTGPDALPNPTSYAPPFSDGVPYDVGAAQAFADRYGDRVRFDHRRDQWLVWHDHFWRPDSDGEIYRLAARHAELWRDEVSRCLAYANRKNLLVFTLKLARQSALDSMLKSLAWHQTIASNGEQWDQNQWLLGVQNGVVDLRTGELRCGRHDDWITNQTRAPFDPNATCPRWLRFLDEVMCGDRDVVDYLHKSLGYSLTGDMSEQCFYMMIGGGANGKSILLDTLEHVWGSYAHRANIKIFIGDDSYEKFHLAECEGKRLILCAESKPNTRINEHTVKNWTGGETQSAERKNVQPFTFRPIGKLWISTNHQPRVIDDSHGFWRRVRMIEFNRTFTETDEDRNLKDALVAEAPGILAWMVRGCLRWQREGLTPPIVISNAIAEYRQQEDPLNEFFVDVCEPAADEQESFVALYAAYDSFCDRMRIQRRDRLSRRAMLNNLKRRMVSFDDDGIVKFRGVRIKAAKAVAQDMFASDGTDSE